MPVSSDSITTCLKALTIPKKGRIKVVKQALANGLLSNTVFTSPLVGALSDRSAVFANTLAEEVLPQIGQSLLEPLIDGFDDLPDPVKHRRLRVIRKLDFPVAQECARKTATSKHNNLAIESIETLSGSEQDAALLISLASNRSRERSFASYRALAGISCKDVQDFLRESMLQGRGSPELAIAFHPNKTHSSTIIELLSNELESLEQDVIPSESKARHIVSTIEAAAGQNCEAFDSVLTRCIKIAEGIYESVEPYATFSLDFTEATLEAIATNPVNDAQEALLIKRGEFGIQFQIYALSAAANLDRISLFEKFAPKLKEQNNRGRCRGWECAMRLRPWPCSIVSAIEYVLSLENGESPKGHLLAHQTVLIDKLREEPRWKKAIEDLTPPE